MSLDRILHCFRLQKYEKDALGRPIVPIRSEAELQDYTSHPQKLPSGDILFRSAIPLSSAHKALFDALAKSKRHLNARIGLTGPPPESVQEQLQKKVIEIVNHELQDAANLSPESLENLRNRASLADVDGFLVFPAFYGDQRIGKALIKAMDIHRFGDCPLKRWLQQEFIALLPIAAGYLQVPADELTKQIVIECQGGIEGLEPSTCKVSEGEFGTPQIYTLTISHGFSLISSLAAKSCAARVRISEDKTHEVTAKEINDSLRAAIAWYLGELAIPQTDTIAQRLLPHQLVVLDHVVGGMRRFTLAHELGHILLWKTEGSFAGFRVPIKELTVAARSLKVPSAYEKNWVDEICCDLLGAKLLQDSVNASALGQNPENLDETSLLRLCWDFTGINLTLVLWGHLISMGTKAKQIDPHTHPPADLRKMFIEKAYAPWLQKFGAVYTGMLMARLNVLFNAFPASAGSRET